MQRVLLRYLSYTFAVALIMVLMLSISSRLPSGLGFDQVVAGTSVHTSEFSLVELTQDLLLLVCAAIFGWVAWCDRLRRPMAVSLVVFMLTCLIRELDFILNFYLVDNLWQLLCGVLSSFFLVYVVRHRERFAQGWKRSWPSAGLAMILGGLILLLPYAQVLGWSVMWQSILGDNYVRLTKIAVEEFAELGAYLLITIGTVEFLYAWSRLPRSRRRRATGRSRKLRAS